MSSAMDVDEEDTLVSRRPKRSTAGNRMEAALAELGLEDLTKEADDDNDFFVEKDEEDIFGSDFESTDEETAQADVDAGDKSVDEEEKRARKSAKTRLEKTTAAAHARNKVTFNPQASTSTSPSKAKAKGRRVSFADGGEILDDEDGGDRHEGASSGTVEGSPKSKKKAKGKGKRQSRRSHTVLNTSATVSRMRSAEKRRATNPKKQPTIQKSYTQAQLLSRALDTEEGNIMEHRDYLQMEEEKRRRARVVRKVVEGPKIRWVSRGEEVRVHVPVPVLAPVPYGYGYTSGSGYYSYQAVGGQHYPNAVPNTSGSGTPHYPNVSTNQPSTTLSLSTSTTVLNPTPVYYPNQTQQQQPQPQTSYYYSPHSASQQPLPQPVTRLEKVCKNYVVHETSQGQSQTHPLPKPVWEETMAALFGGDVKWDDLKVWSGKARPLSRLKQTCPLTGLPAPYLDPRTNVPFANLRAYDTLTNVLKHEYVWSARLGRYVSKEGERRAMGIEVRGKKSDVKGKAKEKGKERLELDPMDVS